MKKLLLAILLLSGIMVHGYAQLELTSGYAIDKNLASGAPIQVAYDFRIKNRVFTKTQIGFRYFMHYNDFVGATIKNTIWEVHQLISYELIRKKQYVLKPNVGFNFRWYKWRGEMVPPLNDPLASRGWVISTRHGNYILESTSTGYYREYAPRNFGFSFQLQNQFRITDKIWIHVTPFIEPDYDRAQNNGGCYFGIILPQLRR